MLGVSAFVQYHEFGMRNAICVGLWFPRNRRTFLSAACFFLHLFYPIIHLFPGTYEMSFVVMAQHKNVNIAMQGIASQTGTSGLA